MSMKQILEELKMGYAIKRFEEERIDVDNFLSVTDLQLINLVIITIGDRIRLTERVKRNARSSVLESADDFVATDSNPIASILSHQRKMLFGNKKSKRRHSFPVNHDPEKLDIPKRRKVTRTWTMTVVCLADKESSRVPSSAEKEILFKAGLGTRKIQFLTSDTEADVLKTITSDRSTENGQTIGFPQLNNCGGFELLKCTQNSRELSLIDCEWSVSQLKTYLGSQTKIYIRPVQTSLSTTPIDNNFQIKTEEICKFCNKGFSIRNLRQHVKTCKDKPKTIEVCESDSDDLPDPALNDHGGLWSFLSDANIEFLPAAVDAVDPLGDAVPINASTSVTDVIDEVSQTEGNSNYNEHASSSSSNVYVHTGEEINSSSDSTTSSTQNVTVSPTMYQKAETVCLIDSVISSAIDHCLSENITDPVEILRHMQKVIVTGRSLELDDLLNCDSGDTSFIMVDRGNILETAFDEIKSITDKDLRKTLEVNFYNECASDQGGPRKEFFRLVLSAVKEKYFDKGLREHLAKDYVTVGKIMGGRRGDVSLQHILQFVTGASEEPILGFCHPPSIEFVKPRDDTRFIPTANTCINSLKLPRGTLEIKLPADEELFSLYDYAFLNTFYGLI
ncbi:uncharacterized protein [Magallana gigas]|uniref:uncharacterized protein isoform X2 n=1 Tax=Magallana gigas TaxID=29159 RepID=UPI0033426671